MGRSDRRNIFRVDDKLDAETTAYIGGNDANGRFRQVERPGKAGAKKVWRLMGYPDCHLPIDHRPFGKNDTRLERQSRTPPVSNLEINDQIGFGEGAIDIAGDDLEVIVGVGGNGGVDDRRVARGRTVDI